MRSPFASVMSIISIAAGIKGTFGRVRVTFSTTSGTKSASVPCSSKALIRYSRRQIARSEHEIPYRRAVADPC